MLFFTREQRVVLGICVLASLLFCGAILYNRQRASNPTNPPLFTESPLPRIAKSEFLIVHVAGKVRKPGVYSLKYGSRVQDALQRAGGTMRDGDPHALNLAAFLKDGEKVEVPSKAEALAALDGSAYNSSPPANRNALVGSSNSASPPAGQIRPPTQPGRIKPPIGWLSRHKVNLNRAGVAQLQQLPGIGPAMAERILAYRREKGSFASIEDLKNVSGIGDKRFAAIRDLVAI